MGNYSFYVNALDNLVSYYTFNEADGATVMVDQTGNHDGTYTNSPGLETDSLLIDDPDYAIEFDGLTQRASIPYSADFAFIGDYTISYIYSTTETFQSANGYIFNQPNTNGISIRTEGGNAGGNGAAHAVKFTHVQNVTVSERELTDGTVRHYVFVRRGTTLEVWLNGRLNDTTTGITVSQMSGTNANHIGNIDGTGANSEQFKFDEFFIVSEALSQSTIEDLYRISINYSNVISSYDTYIKYLMPDAYWRLDESGATAEDSSVHDKHAQYSGTMTQEDDGLLTADTNKAVTLSGGYVRRTGSTLYDYDDTPTSGNKLTELSVHAIFNLDSLASDMFIYHESLGGNSTTLALYISSADSKLKAVRGNLATNIFSSVGTFNVGTDYHIVYVEDHPNRTLYVNGVSDNSDALREGLDASEATFTGIGCTYAAGSKFVGTLDEVAPFGYALTETNASELNILRVSGYSAPIITELNRKPINYGHIIITDEDTVAKTMELTIGANSVAATATNKPILIHLTQYQTNDDGNVANIFTELGANWDKLYIEDDFAVQMTLWKEYWNETENILRFWAIVPSLTTASKVLTLTYDSAGVTNPDTNEFEMIGTTNT